MSVDTPSRELDFLGSRAKVLADAESTGGALGLVDMLEMPPGDMPPLHVHRDQEEGFYVLAGELTLYTPGESVTLTPGEWRLAPRGVPHTYRVGDTPARVLVISSPAGFEAFVAGVAALEAPDPAALGAVAAQHGIEILGPPGMLP